MDITIHFYSAVTSIRCKGLSLEWFWRQLITGTLCILFTVSECYAAERALLDLSIEELGEIKVTSVSKKSERLASAAASIYVITADSIRRSGARSLPEALRLAPNLHVAQINASQYAISARGFNSSIANKLLVLIDGRIVYTPLYSGVFWDSQEVMLKDIDHIEVISGPGGTLWGANAVNGVINIITKSSSATTGDLLYTSVGNIERSTSLRHGGKLGANNGNYRVYAKFSQWEQSVRADGTPVANAWDRSQAGFRSDWATDGSNFTLQGDTYRNSIDQAALEEETNNGTNLLGRWNKKLINGSTLEIQTYLDHTTRDIPGTYRQELDIFDLQIQYSLPEENGKRLIWGGGYRAADDHVEGSARLAFLPVNKNLAWTNVFAQYEQRLWSSWQLTLGGKFERNTYSGVDFLPKLKLAWQVTDNELFWARLARGVRAPSRIDTDLYAPGNAPHTILAGGPDFRSEVAHTLELGWRAQQSKNLSYSLVVFHNEYDHLRSLDTQPSGVLQLGNNIKGSADGLESLVSYQATNSWTLEASAVLLDEHFNDVARSPITQGNDPDWQWGLSSKWNLSANQQLDFSIRRVGALHFPYIPAYTLVNIHYGWMISDEVELQFNGRNLLDRYHQEFASGSGAQLLNPIQIERSLDMAVTVRF